MSTPSSTLSEGSTSPVVPQFTVHSIFRHSHNNTKMVPHGLEWDMGGDSHVAYVPLLLQQQQQQSKSSPSNSTEGETNSTTTPLRSSVDILKDLYRTTNANDNKTNIVLGDTPAVRRAIVEAHNRWCFAKDLPFRTVDDIISIKLPSFIENVDSTSTAGGEDTFHYYVQWKPMSYTQRRYQETPSLSMQRHDDTITTDPSATGEIPPSEVWLNGTYIGMLSPETVSDITQQIDDCPSLKLSVKKSYTTTLSDDDDDDDNDDDNSSSSIVWKTNPLSSSPSSSTTTSTPVESPPSVEEEETKEKDDDAVVAVAPPPTRIIRVERKFRGGIRGYDVFDHMLDNLFALEDIELLSSSDNSGGGGSSSSSGNKTTFIGTATVPDWIMGGDLTSRLWVQKDHDTGDIQFYRPLYHDDISTTDRRYRLVYQKQKDDDGNDGDQTDSDDGTSSYDELYRRVFPKESTDDNNRKISVVDRELDRLRYLSGLPLPFPELLDEENHQQSTKIMTTPRERQHKRNRRRFFGL